MRITNAGKVGIGTNNPGAPLHVYNSNGTNMFRIHGGDHAYMEWFYGANTTRKAWVGYGGASSTEFTITNQAGGDLVLHSTNNWIRTGNKMKIGNNGSTTGYPYGLEVRTSYQPSSGAWITIKAEAVVQGQEFYTNSDRRIKKNIVDVPDQLALQQVRDIPCRYYEYINQEANGTYKTIGYIAQEVKEIFPMAVNTNPDFIPDEYRLLENISWIPTSDNKFKLVSDLTNVSGVKYRFYVPENNEIPSVRSKIIEVIGNSDNTFTFDASHQQVFCYGKEVDDFHTIDKAKIFALHHSAIQEIDRLQLEEKDKVVTLETKVTALEAKNTELETKNTELETKNAELQEQINIIMSILKNNNLS